MSSQIAGSAKDPSHSLAGCRSSIPVGIAFKLRRFRWCGNVIWVPPQYLARWYERWYERCFHFRSLWQWAASLNHILPLEHRRAMALFLIQGDNFCSNIMHTNKCRRLLLLRGGFPNHESIIPRDASLYPRILWPSHSQECSHWNLRLSNYVQ